MKKMKLFLQDVDPRRRQEVADSLMINADYNAIGNFPREFINRTFNANKYVARFKPGHDEITGY